MKKHKQAKHQAFIQTQMSQRKVIRQPLAINQQILQIKSDIDTNCVHELLRQDSQTKTVKSSASKVIVMKHKNSQVQSQEKKQSQNPTQNTQLNQIQTDKSYQILDLTFTFISLKLNNLLVAIIFGALLLIRYYTFGSLLYVMLEQYVSHWKWIFIIILNRFLYFCIVVKISLKIPQSKTQLILKKNWNCMESQVHQYFQVLNARKLVTSILRGLIPAELSFLYIKSQTRTKKFQIYSTINFIYSSIECVIYYPFFMVYMNYINSDNAYALNIFNINITLLIVLFAEVIMFCLTIYLVGIGIERKYGTFSNALKQFFSFECCKSSNNKKNDGQI